MLERKIVTVEGFGEAFFNAASATYKRGVWVKPTAVFGTQTGNRTGLARTSSIGFAPATSGESRGTTVGIATKLLFSRDGADLDNDYLTSGDGMIVYFGGWFETDQYDNSLDSATPGTLLYLNSSSTLATGAHGYPRARFWGKKTTFNSSYAATGMIYIEVLPQASPVSTGS